MYHNHPRVMDGKLMIYPLLSIILAIYDNSRNIHPSHAFHMTPKCIFIRVHVYKVHDILIRYYISYALIDVSQLSTGPVVWLVCPMLGREI